MKEAQQRLKKLKDYILLEIGTINNQLPVGSRVEIRVNNLVIKDSLNNELYFIPEVSAEIVTKV